MSAVKIIEPIEITDSMLIGSDIPENDHAAWSSSITYALGARVIVVSTHKVYESLQAGNVGKNPVSQPTWWSEVKPTNRWAAFDTSNSTETVTNGGVNPAITYEIKASSVDSIALLNVSDATSASVTMSVPTSGVVYSNSISFLGIPYSSDWWGWFFGERTLRPTQFVLTDMPMYADANIIITLYGSIDLSVGVILLGRSKRIGRGLVSGARVGIQDYSRKEKNGYGDTVLVERAFAKRANYQVIIESNEIDSTISYMSNVRAKPCLWIGGSYEALVIFGFYKSFEILISYATHSEFSLEVEGLT